MLKIIVEQLLGAAAEHAIKILADALRRENEQVLKRTRPPAVKFVTTIQLTKDALSRHVEKIRRWSEKVNFSELSEKKRVRSIYVEVDTYLLPLAKHSSTLERDNKRPLFEVLHADPGHAVIIGTAGAGKTTSLKKICVDFFAKGKVLLNWNFPLWITLHDLNDTESLTPIFDKIQEILAIQVQFPKSTAALPPTFRASIVRQVVSAYLDSLGAVILLDGFDEISSETLRELVRNDFESLAKSMSKSKLILTSRSSDFRSSSEFFNKFELAPLSIEQVSTFAHRWLASEQEALVFLKKVTASPFGDTAMRPLIIAWLCAIFERTGDIPAKPKLVYKRVVDLLLKEWDEERSVRRSSAYAGFDSYRKSDFLAHLAFELTVKEQLVAFNSSTLRKLYSQIHSEHGLPENQAAMVVKEIESHNGLIIQGGHDTFEFAHKSIQEFLAADYIVRLPSVHSLAPVFRLLPEELAIATALSSKPGEYLSVLMMNIIGSSDVSDSWYAKFATRLVLEKPELIMGHTIYTTVAILQLLTKAKLSEKLIPVISSLIPPDVLGQLSELYTVRSCKDGVVLLARLPTRPNLTLPRVLSVPEIMVRRRADA